MRNHGLEFKVGLFVLICLAAGALLIMKFSKGTGLFTPTFNITLKSYDVGGIIPGSNVLMSGVPIGNVTAVELAPDGKSVLITVKILRKYRVRADSVFAIRSSGFLGDRFIAVTPGAHKEGDGRDGVLKDGDMVECEEPFDLEQVARTASGLVGQINQMVARLDRSVARIDEILLSRATLDDLTNSVANIRQLSSKSLAALSKVDTLLESNTPAIGQSVTNLSLFTQKLDNMAQDLRLVIASNKVEIAGVMTNLRGASERAKDLMDDVSQGRGLVGKLLVDDQVAEQFSSTSSNLMILSSNVNTRGIWGVLFKPKRK